MRVCITFTMSHSFTFEYKNICFENHKYNCINRRDFDSNSVTLEHIFQESAQAKAESRQQTLYITPRAIPTYSTEFKRLAYFHVFPRLSFIMH